MDPIVGFFTRLSKCTFQQHCSECDVKETRLRVLLHTDGAKQIHIYMTPLYL